MMPTGHRYVKPSLDSPVLTESLIIDTRYSLDSPTGFLQSLFLNFNFFFKGKANYENLLLLFILFVPSYIPLI